MLSCTTRLLVGAAGIWNSTFASFVGFFFLYADACCISMQAVGSQKLPMITKSSKFALEMIAEPV
jgi:hypothetical protein